MAKHSANAITLVEDGLGSDSKASVSVVISFSNNEADVMPVIEDIHRCITSRIPSSEIVAVDNQSRDQTWAALREVCGVYDEVKIYRMREPSNFGACAMRGFIEAKKKIVFHLEPHCPWSAEIFWILAKKKVDEGRGAVFAVREPSKRRWREKMLGRLFRDETLGEWPSPVPDIGFPAQLFSKSDFEKIHILIPENAVAPGLYLYLLFISLRRPVNCVTIKVPATMPGRRRMPVALAGFSAMRNCGEQLKRLRKNLGGIQGLVEI